jgi:hypothetical protein
LSVRLHGIQYRPAHPQSGLVRAFCLVFVGVLGWVGYSDFAEGADLDGGDAAKSVSTLPNIYLDLRTVYSRVPANSLSIGFSNPSSVSSAIATLQTLSTLPNATSPNLSSPASQSIGIDVPLTVDLNDRVSVYGGFSASAPQSGLSDWSTLAISSWNVGFWTQVFQQNGGSIPTITLQSTLTRSVPASPLATTSLNSTLEFDYALNKDETKGLLAGVQDVAVSVDSPLAKIDPDIVGYIGGYYQWANNWKLTGRAGVQWFGGAQLLNLTPFEPFTQPIVRFDLDRYDDNGNRLFGVTAEIAWMPKPAYQLTVRTPLYFVRN